MKPIEDLDPDVQELVTKTNDLREANGKLLGGLERFGMQFDYAHARSEYFFQGLVDAGILSDEQFWAITLSWEEHFNKQLKDAAARVRERLIAEDEAARRAANKGAKLITPRAPGKLIIPE